jgi:Tfp pilus assembly protein PilO
VLDIVAYRRLMVGVIAMGLIIFLWYSQLFQRQKNEMVRLSNAIENVEVLAYNWVSETKNLSDYHNQYVIKEKEQHRMLSRIPEADQVHELAQQLIEIGKSHGCMVTYVGMPFSQFFSDGDQVVPSRQGDVMILPLQLIVNGSFISTGRYIETLSSLPLFAAFGELGMRRISAGRDELESNFSMYIYIKRNTGTRKGVS